MKRDDTDIAEAKAFFANTVRAWKRGPHRKNESGKWDRMKTGKPAPLASKVPEVQQSPFGGNSYVSPGSPEVREHLEALRAGLEKRQAARLLREASFGSAAELQDAITRDLESVFSGLASVSLDRPYTASGSNSSGPAWKVEVPKEVAVQWFLNRNRVFSHGIFKGQPKLYAVLKKYDGIAADYLGKAYARFFVIKPLFYTQDEASLPPTLVFIVSADRDYPKHLADEPYGKRVFDLLIQGRSPDFKSKLGAAVSAMRAIDNLSLPGDWEMQDFAASGLDSARKYAEKYRASYAEMAERAKEVLKSLDALTKA